MPLPLVERSEQDVAQTVKKRVETLEDVRKCHHVAVRMTGKRVDITMRLSLDSNLRFENVHKIVLNIDREVKRVIPNARVTVQTEPVGESRRNLVAAVIEIVQAAPGSRGVEDIHIQKVDGKLCVDLHLEVSANMTLKQAHKISDEVEQRLKAAKLGLSEITIHMESASSAVSTERGRGDTEIKWYVEHAAEHFPEIKYIHRVRVRKIGDQTNVALNCAFRPNISLKQAHEISNRLEIMIRNAFAEIDRIDVHEEPA